MLSELNEIAKNYEYFIKAVGAFLPFLVAIFMAYIAYQQWKINERAQAVKLNKEFYDDFILPIKQFSKRHPNITFENFYNLSPEEIEVVMTEISQLLETCEKNSSLFETCDFELLKKALEKIKKSISEIEKHKIKPTLKEIWKAMNALVVILTTAYGYGYQYTKKHLTIYGVIGSALDSIYGFVTPYFLQKIIKRAIYSVATTLILAYLIVYVAFAVFKVVLPAFRILLPILLLPLSLPYAIVRAILETLALKKGADKMERNDAKVTV